MNIDLLKKRKQELGLTNQELSSISGISLGTINKITTYSFEDVIPVGIYDSLFIDFKEFDL